MGTTIIVQVMRRVLITGGAGFIGSSLVNALMISRNCNIRGFFNIGSDDTTTVMQIAQIIIDQLSLKRDNVRNVFKNTLD